VPYGWKICLPKEGGKLVDGSISTTVEKHCPTRDAAEHEKLIERKKESDFLYLARLGGQKSSRGLIGRQFFCDGKKGGGKDVLVYFRKKRPGAAALGGRREKEEFMGLVTSRGRHPRPGGLRSRLFVEEWRKLSSAGTKRNRWLRFPRRIIILKSPEHSRPIILLPPCQKKERGGGASISRRKKGQTL